MEGSIWEDMLEDLELRAEGRLILNFYDSELKLVAGFILLQQRKNSIHTTGHVDEECKYLTEL